MTTKILFITLLILSLENTLFAQNPNIYIGKRKNIIWDRKIDYRNLGSIYTYYYPVFYKTNTQSYRKAGMFGGRLAPYMATDPDAWTEFKKFKRNKAFGYVLLGGAIASLCSWSYVTANYMVKNDEYGIKPFFKWRQLPFLGAYFVCFYSSVHLNLKSDLNLKKAVRIYDRS